MKRNLFNDVLLSVCKYRTSWLLTLLFMSFQLNVMAQNVDIRGVVKGTDGKPIPGVNVVLKNTSNGVATGVDGKYALTVPADGILVFSFIGYQTQEIPVEGKTTINITLEENASVLSEVVVVGYGTQRKSDITGAVVSVKASDIEKLPVTTTDQVLQGRAVGVTVTTNSGSPGTPVQIRVRGVGTINNSSPLFVVDGFPLDDISFLNPTDIASMEILKDASATAIYGSRGANGVIMITTKNGKVSEMPTITFDSYYGVSQMWRKPELLNASQWAMLRVEALKNSGNDLSSLDSTLLDYQSFGKGTDWVDEVTRTAYTRNVNLSVSGGTEKFTYFLSANNFAQQGIVKKSDFERTSVRINTTLKAKKWLTIGENLTIESNKTRRINEDDEWSAVLIQAVTSDPITPVRRPNGYFSYSDYVQSTNPVAHLEYTNSEDKNVRIVGGVFGEVNFSKSLSFKSNLGINYSNDISNDFLPTYLLYQSDDEINSSSSNYVSYVYRNNSVDRSWNWSNYFVFNKQFGKHNFSLMAGIEASQEISDPFSGRKTNLVGETTSLRNFDNALDPNAVVDGLPEDKRISSYFGRLNYDFSGKYLFTANIRRDGSSVFGSGKRYGVFPSFSLGWKISQENFMSGQTTISNLKLRAGWGQIGNDKIPLYRYLNTGSAGGKYVFGEKQEINNGVYFPGIENKDLHWEATTTTNVGLDLGLWGNKITMSAEYYVKKTEDMLVDAPAPLHVGLQVNRFENVGTMENSGFELELNYKETKGDFNYEFGVNFATFKNEVTGLGSQSEIQMADLRNGGYISRTMVGKPIAQFWGRKTQGLFQTQAEVDAWVDNHGNPLQPDAEPGDIRYAKNDTGGIFEGIIGNPLPKFTYGFNAQFSYKGIDLNLFFQGVYGNDLFNGTMVYTERPDLATNVSTRLLDRWTGPNSTNDAHNPKVNSSNASNILFSDRYVEDGSYLRLKNIQLGYTFPRSVSQAVNIQKLRIYLGATNLFTFTKYKGFDPEIGEGYDGSLDLGIDRATYPQPRTFLLGLNITF